MDGPRGAIRKTFFLSRPGNWRILLRNMTTTHSLVQLGARLAGLGFHRVPLPEQRKPTVEPLLPVAGKERQ